MTKSVGTESNSFEIMKVWCFFSLNPNFTSSSQYLEDEIHFKNQEIKEFLAEIKSQDEKIKRLESLHHHLSRVGETENKESNAELEEKLKLQVISPKSTSVST